MESILPLQRPTVFVSSPVDGSTNAIVHLIAIARRAGVALDLARFDALARRTPVLANVRPSGKFLMEDFFYAGGLRGLLSRLADLLDGSASIARSLPPWLSTIYRTRSPQSVVLPVPPLPATAIVTVI